MLTFYHADKHWHLLNDQITEMHSANCICCYSYPDVATMINDLYNTPHMSVKYHKLSLTHTRLDSGHSKSSTHHMSVAVLMGSQSRTSGAEGKRETNVSLLLTTQLHTKRVNFQYLKCSKTINDTFFFLNLGTHVLQVRLCMFTIFCLVFLLIF